jgi:hypothetical protein
MKEACLETFIKTILDRDSEKLEDITLSCYFWPQVGAAMAITVAFVLILEGQHCHAARLQRRTGSARTIRKTRILNF